jgi:hypothetical protein
MAPTQPSNTEHLGGAIATLIMAFLSGKVHTATLGRVEKYDKATRTGDIRPMLRKANVDGTQISYGLLYDVPFWTYGTSGAGVVLPVAKGDFVLLVFCEKKADGFFSTGQESDTSVNRVFDLSDAVAFPGIFPASSNIPATNDADITIYNSGSGNIVLGDSLTAEKLLNSTFKTMIFDMHVHTGGTISGSTGMPTAIPDPTGLSMTNKVKAS